jgi:hypothetical protein
MISYPDHVMFLGQRWNLMNCTLVPCIYSREVELKFIIVLLSPVSSKVKYAILVISRDGKLKFSWVHCNSSVGIFLSYRFQIFISFINYRPTNWLSLSLQNVLILLTNDILPWSCDVSWSKVESYELYTGTV